MPQAAWLSGTASRLADRLMPRVLRISNKLWSLRHRIEVFDDAGTVIYSCSRASLFSRSFVVISEQTEVARIRRKLFSWTPIWLVESKAGDFAIRTRVFSLRRVYDVKGGRFHGAQVRGNLWDVNFMIVLSETLVARANKRLISLRDTHAIEVVQNDDASELFSVVATIVILLHNKQKRDEERSERRGQALDDGYVRTP